MFEVFREDLFLYNWSLVDGEHEAVAALEPAAVVQPPHPVGRREAGVEGDAAQLEQHYKEFPKVY